LPWLVKIATQLAPYCLPRIVPMKKPIGADTNDNGNSTKDCGHASLFLDDEMMPKMKRSVRIRPKSVQSAANAFVRT